MSAEHAGPPSVARLQCLARLNVLRDELQVKNGGGSWLSAGGHEWAALSREHRIVILMLAGVDEVEAMWVKGWQEYTPGEAMAIQITLRQLKAAMGGIVALARK